MNCYALNFRSSGIWRSEYFIAPSIFDAIHTAQGKYGDSFFLLNFTLDIKVS